MTVNQIYLDGFRNYTDFTADFSPSVNVIIGNNAQGKTNLLEAMYYLTSGRSFRAKNDRELIGFDRDDAVIRAHIDSQGRRQKLEARLSRGRRRQFRANDMKLSTAADLSGRLTAVLFCPDDLEMIRSGAAVRRKLMDSFLCQLRPRYALALSEYNRILDHKTRILRDYHEKPSLLDTLDDFDLRLAQTGAELISVRAAYSALLSGRASGIHAEFSGGTERLTVTYQTVRTIDDPKKKPAELLPFLLEHLKDHRRAELESGLCLSGPHKDDLDIAINGVSARSFASQGQARTAALSIKLAERAIHYEDRGEYPILLLDDVLSELDKKRQNFVLNHIGDGQVFISCCEDSEIMPRTGGHVLRIEAGRLAGS
jgi:DNA replication and repair protein RecF